MAFLSRQTLGKKLHCSVMENLNRELLVFSEKTASNGLSDKKKFDNCTAFAKYIQINIYVQPNELRDFFQLFSFNKLFRNID